MTSKTGPSQRRFGMTACCFLRNDVKSGNYITMRMPVASYAPMRVFGPPPVTTILSDSFTDAPGTNLVSHAPEIGGPWSVLLGSAGDFQIDNTGGREFAPG